MTASHREQIIERIVTVITNLNIVGATVTRSRAEPAPRSEGPSIQIMADQDDSTVMTVNPAPIQEKINIVVKVIVRGDVPDQIADPFMVQIWHGILSDVSLNGLAQDVTPLQYRFEVYSADSEAGIAFQTFVVDYRIRQYDDLTS